MVINFSFEIPSDCRENC